jgi:hypothetical protein
MRWQAIQSARNGSLTANAKTKFFRGSTTEFSAEKNKFIQLRRFFSAEIYKNCVVVF